MTATPSLIIGLTGRKRTGKDTFAARLVEAHGYTRAAFADGVKAAALALDPVVYPGEHLDDAMRLSEIVEELGWETAKDDFPEVRRTLQRLGTDVVRAINPDTWVDAAFAALDTDGPVVFTDVRFPNEADAIRARGGLIGRIERKGVDDGDTHASETAMDGYDVDFTVKDPNGDRTIEDLRATADAIAHEAPLVAFLKLIADA
ncbi:deoxynucleoside monophosphate kinase [Arthrobacter phage BaileyBlu]|uniref:Deoxynucleoside monophosphate kinase n=1 Tax=Arthrobacter phage BaileyBlu TaxID=2910754 RepID=A0AA49BP98_9CAUD|nr:deoxynucleoside monophosphate kinase [Arthrobacter phage BaileyBlu]UJQ87161.1 deoxynucleoside monophosphate kinase [Arthrobacter phage BaileyBlu]